MTSSSYPQLSIKNSKLTGIQLLGNRLSDSLLILLASLKQLQVNGFAWIEINRQQFSSREEDEGVNLHKDTYCPVNLTLVKSQIKGV